MLHSWAKFGLRSSLLATAASAALFASYRIGFDQGRLAGPLVPIDHSASTIYGREYDVSDIVKSESDAEALIAGIRDAVAPESWDVQGGYAVMEFDAGAKTIAIEQIWPHHVLVVDYLHELRRSARRIGSPPLARMIEDASRGFSDNVARYLPTEPAVDQASQ